MSEKSITIKVLSNYGIFKEYSGFDLVIIKERLCRDHPERLEWPVFELTIHKEFVEMIGFEWTVIAAEDEETASEILFNMIKRVIQPISIN